METQHLYFRYLSNMDLSILFFKDDCNVYISTTCLVSVNVGGLVSPRGHMLPSSTVDFGWFLAFWEHQYVLKIWLKL